MQSFFCTNMQILYNLMYFTNPKNENLKFNAQY